MAVCCSSIVCGVLPTLPHPRTRFKTTNLSYSRSLFLSSDSTKLLLPKLQITGLRNRKFHAVPVIFAAQSSFFRAIQTVFKIGKDGVEAGTSLVPDAVPRPVARLSVTVVATALFLFVLRSFLSTVFFALRKPSPFFMYSKALLISEKDALWVKNLSRSSSCKLSENSLDILRDLIIPHP